MKDKFMMKFNELDDLCKTVFITETPDFKPLRLFADSLKQDVKSLLLNIISIRNIATHSKISLFTINKESINVIEGFIQGLKRVVEYTNYEINPLIEVKKTDCLNEVNDFIQVFEKNIHKNEYVNVRQKLTYLYDCFREIVNASSEAEVEMYYNEAKSFYLSNLA